TSREKGTKSSNHHQCNCEGGRKVNWMFDLMSAIHQVRMGRKYDQHACSPCNQKGETCEQRSIKNGELLTTRRGRSTHEIPNFFFFIPLTLTFQDALLTEDDKGNFKITFFALPGH